MTTETRPVTWSIHEYPAGNITEAHTHAEAQLLYASSGVMTVETAQGLWVAPPHRAVWIPPNERHAVSASNALSLRTIRFDTAQIRGLPDNLTVLAVTPLLRALVLSLALRPEIYDEQGPDGRAIAVIIDELRALEQVPLYLPYPQNAALGRVADLLTTDPSLTLTIEEWAAEVSMSSRSFARHFQRETGLSFGQWRQQARLLAALQSLADGATIATTAADLGYESESAFIAMFRKAMGTTPGRYFDERARDTAI